MNPHQALAHSHGVQGHPGSPGSVPPAVTHGGHHAPVQAAPEQAYAAPAATTAWQAAPVATRVAQPAWTTGAYELTGDPSIDRMIRLEAACKRFGM